MGESGRRPVVHLLCGLNGAGKTTYARRLADDTPAVRFSLDAWMLRLHPVLRFDDPGYPERAAVCRELIWETARQVLRTGTDAVLDWNLWSRARRAEWAGRARDAGYSVRVHHLDVPVDVAAARVGARTAADAHPLDAADVRHLAALFEPPDAAAEGLDVVRVRASAARRAVTPDASPDTRAASSPDAP